MEHAIVFILCHANGTWTEEEVVVTKDGGMEASRKDVVVGAWMWY